MKIRREWAMPSGDTLSIKPIREFVKSHIHGLAIGIDPFARNQRLAKYTNDLNPKTDADSHLDALDFVKLMQKKKVVADFIIFDPPYSYRQTVEIYESIGRKWTQKDQQQVGRWTEEKNLLSKLLKIGGKAISFGWNSAGFGKSRGFEIEEILLVAHGSAHNDTICTAEVKRSDALSSTYEP